jgi:hypothetical protein
VPYPALGKVPDMRTPLADSLPSAIRQTLGKGNTFAGTLGKDSVSVTRRRNGCFSLPSALWHSVNNFAKCPRKSTRQWRFCRCIVCRALFAECDTRQSVYRVFLRLCRVLVDSGSDLPSYYTRKNRSNAACILGLHCSIHMQWTPDSTPYIYMHGR